MKKKEQLGDVIGRDVATQELNRWFDLMEVPEDDRIVIEESDDPEFKAKESNDIMRESMIKAIMKGRLKINDEGVMSYDLKHPLTKKDSGETILSKLTFLLRYRDIDLEINMKGVDTNNYVSMTRAYVATLTGTGKHLLGKLYNTDTDVLRAVYTVFMRGDA